MANGQCMGDAVCHLKMFPLIQGTRSFFCLEQLNAMAAKSLEHCRVERDEKGSTLNSIDECESDKNSTEAKS